jgi:hypothetical protein
MLSTLAYEAAGAVVAPAFPAPSVFGRPIVEQNSGALAPRERCWLCLGGSRRFRYQWRSKWQQIGSSSVSNSSSMCPRVSRSNLERVIASRGFNGWSEGKRRLQWSQSNCASVSSRLTSATTVGLAVYFLRAFGTCPSQGRHVDKGGKP